MFSAVKFKHREQTWMPRASGWAVREMHEVLRGAGGLRRSEERMSGVIFKGDRTAKKLTVEHHCVKTLKSINHIL